MSRKRVLQGSKISSKHSSFIDIAVPVIEAAKTLPEVSKIILGEIVRVGGGKTRIKFVPLRAGFRVTVRGRNTQQTLLVYTSNPSSTEKALLQAWEKK